MIFVTVGTHEQQFNRLVKVIDDLVSAGKIKEKVIIQKGYSDYEPKSCKYHDFLGYEQMQKNIHDARIVITHGGPSSFMSVLAVEKTPIVVPRQKKYGEHVNDHQLTFCKEVKKRMNNIIVVEDIKKLADLIENYDKNITRTDLVKGTNNKEFCQKMEKTLKEWGYDS